MNRIDGKLGAGFWRVAALAGVILWGIAAAVRADYVYHPGPSKGEFVNVSGNYYRWQTAGGTTSTPLPTADLWGYWPMQTDANDTSGNGRNLTPIGTWSYSQSGAPDGGLCALKTNDDYGRLTQPSNVNVGIGANATFCMWFKVIATGSATYRILWSPLTSTDGSFYESYVSTGWSPISYNYAAVNWSYTGNADTIWGTGWRFYAVTYSHGADNWRVWHGFSDGTLVERTLSSNVASSKTSGMRFIGYHATAAYQLRNLYVGPIAIYTAAKTPAEIQAIFDHMRGN